MNTVTPTPAGDSVMATPIAAFKKKKDPLVTIGIPTYNGGSAVKRAVASVLAQTYSNIEIAISDNASDNETAFICRQLAKAYSCVRYFRQTHNIGMQSNFNFLLKHAEGKYFMWLADDDVLGNDALVRYVDFLEENPSYSIVSGAIEYLQNGSVHEYERGFNIEHRSPTWRVLHYYFTVVHGAMYHGLMRTALGQQLAVRKIIGSDWHFVASLAFLGKIRNLEFTGYHKSLGGSSYNFVAYAKVIGDSKFAGRYPHFKIATDAYREVTHRSTAFSALPTYKRYTLAALAFLAVWASYGIKLYPRIVAGRVKRYCMRLVMAKGSPR